MFPLNLKIKYLFYIFPNSSDYFTFKQKLFCIFYTIITMYASIIIPKLTFCKEMIVT